MTLFTSNGSFTENRSFSLEYRCILTESFAIKFRKYSFWNFDKHEG